MGSQTIDAVVFDLDGVITDTAHFHFQAWKQLADELDIQIDEHFNERLKGISRLDSLELILQEGHKEHDYTLEQKEALAEKKNRHYCELLEQLTPNDVLPGILPLIAAIKEEGIPVGLASVSKNVTTVLKALKIEKLFDYCVDAAKIKRSKPDPEIFLTACQNLGANPRNSIGVEDAIAGVESIKASNMFAVGVGETLEKADYRVPTTDLLNWNLIKEMYEKNKKVS